jgi:hypothetical protein
MGNIGDMVLHVSGFGNFDTWGLSDLWGKAMKCMDGVKVV